MKLCSCCHAPAPISACLNVRPWILPFLYGLMGECPNCMSTLAAVMWELSDEQLAELEREEAA